jgi:MarR family transcriptional regulator, organic hydroperoxide resistance regulator
MRFNSLVDSILAGMLYLSMRMVSILSNRRKSVGVPDEDCPVHPSAQCSSSLGVLVGRARRGLRREFEARLAAHDLTAPQVWVLMNLWEEDGRTISDLSRQMSSDGPTLTSLLDRLEAKGLIYRDRDTHDRRTIRIRLQERGRALKDSVHLAREELMDLLRSRMSDTQLDQLVQLLQLLCETVEGNTAGTAGASVEEPTGERHPAGRQARRNAGHTAGDSNHKVRPAAPTTRNKREIETNG